MWKDVLFVAGAAALGEMISKKFGASIEAQATKLKIPVAVGHAVVVGGSAAGGYLILKAIF